MKNFLIKILGVMMLAAYSFDAEAQLMSVKTNALFWANLTPNLSMELVTSKNTSLEGTAFYSPGKTTLDTRLIGVQGEFRYWISGRPMTGMFAGVGLSAFRYDMTLGKNSRHFGDAVAPGVVYGYDFPVGKHWNIEVATGLGYVWFREKKYGYDKDINKEKYNEHGSRIFPTKLCVSVAYLF